MIPFEIEYLRPATIEDAVSLHQDLVANGRTVEYLSGGTELVTMARDGKLTFDALIDLKRIPETTVLDESSGVYGSALRLSELQDRVSDRGIGALIRNAARGVADRTTRNSITLGGNICGRLPYRETVLPFLVADAEVEIAGPEGRRTVALADVFDMRMKLGPSEMLVSFTVGPHARDARVNYQRMTRDPRVDYPLVTLCAAATASSIALAVTGAFSAPVRSSGVDAVISQAAPTSADDALEIARKAAEAFGLAYREDMRASAEYRKAMLVRTVAECVKDLGGIR